ncbi:MAG TPA: retropepsin-like aspartic protease [Gammaproteobacteria bacterium]
MPRPCSLLARALALASSLLCGQALADPGADYARVYAAHDFFTLRAMVAADKGPDSEQKRFYTAAVLSAFNQPAAANRLIDPMLANNIDTALMPFLLKMRMQNDRQLHDYAGALDTARTLIDLYERKGDPRLADAQNDARLLGALSGTPALQVRHSGDSHIILAPDGKRGYCIPVTIGVDPCYALDSGANFSMLIRSEAERLKLKIIPAGVQVGSSNGSVVTADVAVAPSMLLGNVQYDNVVFLVMPDAAFTFGDFQIRGLLGYPVFAGLGAVKVGRGHVIDVPKDAPTRRVYNIALDGNDILTKIQVGDHEALCRVDTGADRTVFYKSYYDLYKDDIEKAGKAHFARSGGAGGVRSHKAYRLPSLQFKLAGRRVNLNRVDVYTDKVLPEDYIQCNIGQDAFRDYRSYTINLQAMALTLD